MSLEDIESGTSIRGIQDGLTVEGIQPGMPAQLVDIIRAVEGDSIVPFFQPLVELRTGRLAGFEVLARWNHPKLGMVLPVNFISTVEENGLARQLMEQVMRKAFLSASSLPSSLMIAINVSPIQLRDPELPYQIQDATHRCGFPLDRLKVEITESAILDNLEQAQAITQNLKEMGCRLALDDFGTGYSSLAHLQALPFDELKIDRSFVASMTKMRDSRKIVAAIVGLGHSLGLTTLAEGIETEEQADILLRLGCEQGQGWLYGRPGPADKIGPLIDAPLRPRWPGAVPGDSSAVSSLEAMPSQHLSQLQAIYDGAPVGLCFLDRDLRYVSINRKMAKMNGHSVAAHMGRTPQELIPLAFLRYQPYLLRALLGESISGVEVARPSNVPGEPDRLTLAFYQPAFDEGDEVIGISIALTDITELSRVEEALRESDDHQRHLSELNHQVAWIMDAKGNSVQVSSQWVRTASLNAARTRSLGWLETLHPDDLERTMKVMKNALQSGDPIDVKYRIRDVNGDWKWVRSLGSPRIGPSGEILRWYGTVEDTDEPAATEKE
jgi:PAS domain S-box-containing protein